MITWQWCDHNYNVHTLKLLAPQPLWPPREWKWGQQLYSSHLKNSIVIYWWTQTQVWSQIGYKRFVIVFLLLKNKLNTILCKPVFSQAMTKDWGLSYGSCECACMSECDRWNWIALLWWKAYTNQVWNVCILTGKHQ